MDNISYLKCPCAKCGARIEFPASGVGMTLPCPHCGEKTTLFAPPAEGADRVAAIPTPQPVDETDRSAEEVGSEKSGRTRYIIAALAVLAIAGVAAGMMFWRSSNAKGGTDAEKVPSAPETNDAVVAAQPPVPRPRSLDDLVVGTISLEKGRGGNLVYAISVLKNNSDHQRFGVTVEVALVDKAGGSAGSATDYRAVLEPREEWRFRALVLNAKAVKAQSARVREAE